MTQIQAVVKDSLGQPLEGFIRITLDYLVNDDTASFLPVPAKVQLGVTEASPTQSPGTATFELEPSEIARVTYYFEIVKVTTSGSPAITTEDVVWAFRAKVPDSVTALKLSDLAQTTGIVRDALDSSITAIVRRLYLSDDFWSRAGEALFPHKGTYSATGWYKLGDLATFQGSSYRCTSRIAITGIQPTDTANWVLMAAKGDPGAGTSGEDYTYNATAWDGVTAAPSKNAVRDLVETLATKTEVNAKVSASGAILTNASLADTLTAADRTSRIAYSSWVQDLLDVARKSLEPVGTLAVFSGTSSPVYWRAANGAAVSRTTYSALFAIIGTTYGVGDGSTTFNLPNPGVVVAGTIWIIHTGV